MLVINKIVIFNVCLRDAKKDHNKSFFIVVAFIASGCSEIGVTPEAACKMATLGIKNKKTKMVKD